MSATTPHATRITVLDLERDAAANQAQQAADDEVFIAWLTSCRRPDHQDPQDRTAAVEHVLDRLVTRLEASSRALPGEVARKLGLPVGTTIGTAAAELRGAVHDPSGPRCSSYPSAVFHLRDRADAPR